MVGLETLKDWWWLALLLAIMIIKSWIIIADVKKWRMTTKNHPSHEDLITQLGNRTGEIQSSVKEVSISLERQGTRHDSLSKAALVLILDTMQNKGASNEGLKEAKELLGKITFSKYNTRRTSMTETGWFDWLQRWWWLAGAILVILAKVWTIATQTNKKLGRTR